MYDISHVVKCFVYFIIDHKSQLCVLQVIMN